MRVTNHIKSHLKGAQLKGHARVVVLRGHQISRDVSVRHQHIRLTRQGHMSQSRRSLQGMEGALCFMNRARCLEKK